jgi:hypothetical protein
VSKIAADNINLKIKVTSLCDVIRLSWEEHSTQQAEDDSLFEQLEQENADLRKMLELHCEVGTMEEIEQSLRHHEKVSEEVEYERCNLEKQEKEAAIESMRGDIEMLLRDEYEQRWHEAMAGKEDSIKEQHQEDPVESAGSSGKFNELFDGQILTQEEQALLKELKQRERDQQTVPDDHFLDDDDDDDDEEDEAPPQQVDDDVQSLHLLLQQSKGFY